jgi:hypothetical protein
MYLTMVEGTVYLLWYNAFPDHEQISGFRESRGEP